MKEISCGAEASVFLTKKGILKIRKIKGYRFPVLDEKLRRQRTRKEARLLNKALQYIPVPQILEEPEEKCFELHMEYIKGKNLSESLDFIKNPREICFEIGKSLAKLHDAGIIHGDLTTSNMILKGRKVYFIDFGLGFQSQKAEDKAVDLHLIREALDARHHKKSKECFSALTEGYKASRNFRQVFRRLKAVEKRGRYKSQY